MKQYLTPTQTAKLIELGFEKPKGEWEYGDYACECCGDTVDEATLIL